MQCPRCKTQVIARRGRCPACGANLALSFKVNLAAGAVILVAGAFFLSLSAAEASLAFLPIGLVELVMGLFIDVRAASGLRRLSAEDLVRGAKNPKKSVFPD